MATTTATAAKTTTHLTLNVDFVPLGQGLAPHTIVAGPLPPNVTFKNNRLHVGAGGTTVRFTVTPGNVSPVGIMFVQQPAGIPVFIALPGATHGKVVPGSPFDGLEITGQMLKIEDDFEMPSMGIPSPKEYKYSIMVKRGADLGLVDPDLENEN